MRPKAQEASPQDDLFREKLTNLINLRHPLCRLAELMPWDELNERFGWLYTEKEGRPGIATRLMAGLQYLKHTYNLSDEAVVERWVENPYWQHFCGVEYFQHEIPIDPSQMTRYRKRIGAAGCEFLLKATISVGLSSGAVQARHLERVTVDTPVMEKAVSPPTDSALPGNPYDGHTLSDRLSQIEVLTGTKPQRCYVDRGYRGHGVTDTEVILAHHKPLTPAQRRELKRRNAIEPGIGHMKSDGRLGCNFLKGALGDALNAVLCGAGHNLRIILRKLRLFWLWILSLYIGSVSRFVQLNCATASCG